MSFQKYLDTVSGDFREAIKIEWLNADESVAFEFTNFLYDIGVDLSVNYHNGSRRTCTLTLNNDRNKFPVDFNNIWFGQKFKLWRGVYIDDKTPYYLPQGVFYVSNPNEVYQPSTRTIKINGVDKWAFLDGTLHGVLSGTYQTNIGNNLYDATRELLKVNYREKTKITPVNIARYFDVENGSYYFKYDVDEDSFVSNNAWVKSSSARTILTAKEDLRVSFDYGGSSGSGDIFYVGIAEKTIFYDRMTATTSVAKCVGVTVLKGEKITFEYEKDDSGDTYDDLYYFKNMFVYTKDDVLDPVSPFIDPYFLKKTSYVLNTDKNKDSTKTYYQYDSKTGMYSEYTGSSFGSLYSTLYIETNVINCPYTAKVERGKTYADVLLEYATILCANIYYDVNGRLTIEPITDEADDITDTNKEIVWNFTVEEKQLLGLETTYNFDKVYNDIIVLGNITNGYQFKARVQNRNPMSDTCIQKIGIKTKEPFEDNQYYSDDQCKELAMYYAKVDTILQKSGDINTTPLYHLDVNKLVSVSTPNNNMSKELFLITGFNLSSSNTMTVNVTSVNVLKDFSVVEVDVYE